MRWSPRERRLPLRRARDASRTKLSREAVRGSGRSAGKVDESAPGSANPWSCSGRARCDWRNCVRRVRNCSQTAEIAFPLRLTDSLGGRRVLIAPRTERLRLMALRQADASAEVSRKAGRRSIGLGAFLRACRYRYAIATRKSLAASGLSVFATNFMLGVLDTRRMRQ